jgi:ABC-type tungstate transport system permease subunit
MSSKVKGRFALAEVAGAGDCANAEAVTKRVRTKRLSFIVRGDSQRTFTRRNSFWVAQAASL